MTDETPSEIQPPVPQSFRRGLKLLASLTAVLGVFPYLIYVPARLTGALSDEATYNKASAAGGPWTGEPIGMLLCAPILLLPLMALLTLLVCLEAARRSRRGRVAALGVGLAGAQLGVALLQLYTVSWVN